MANVKFKLTDEYKINSMGVKVFRIEATASWGSIKKGDKGGFVEKESNISGDAWVYGDAEVFGDAEVYGDARVSGDAWVFGDARVFGDAWVSLKKNYTKGSFVYSSDGKIVPTIIDQSDEPDFNSSEGYRNLLVVGDYEITDQGPQEKETTNPKEIQIDGATYVLKDEV